MASRFITFVALNIALLVAASANDYPALITGAWESANFKGELPYRIYGGRMITPFSPPSGLRQGFYRHAGLAQRLFRSLPQKANS
jgi:hypothetical protein